jgi:hypothetical protein
MMGLYQWHGRKWSRTGCPGEYNDPGWYLKKGDKFVVKEFKNPKTKKKYTDAELAKIK